MFCILLQYCDVVLKANYSTRGIRKKMGRRQCKIDLVEVRFKLRWFHLNNLQIVYMLNSDNVDKNRESQNE